MVLACLAPSKLMKAEEHDTIDYTSFSRDYKLQKQSLFAW